jgi:hypothetical protein
MSYSYNSIYYKLHSALKINSFWPQFIEAISEELELEILEIETTKYFNDIYTQLEDGVIDICKKFGYTPNLILDNSLEFIRREAESIPYRIRNKTTYNGYLFNFKQIGECGDVYNTYWNGFKFIKAVDWSSTFTLLNSGSIDFTKPFTQVISDKNFNVIRYAGALYLDTGHILDDPYYPWFLDVNSEITPTKHLMVEFCTDEIVIRDLKEYLLYNTYFNYLSVGSEYNKRVPVVIHAGCNVNVITTTDGSYNYFNRTKEYTVEDIKLQASVSFLYLKESTPGSLIYLDDGYTLDEAITWTLDQDSGGTSTITIDSYKYMSIGIGSKELITYDNNKIFDPVKTLLYYTLDDENNISTVTDYSLNNNTGTITGNNIKIQGILGKTINFDANTIIVSSDNIIVPSDSLTYSFWFNPNSTDSSGEMYLFDNSFLKASYNYTTEELNIYFDILTSTTSLVKNTVYLVQIEIDSVASELRIFINSSLVDTFDISGILYVGSYLLFLGSNSSSLLKYKGILDTFYIQTKIYTQNEKDYIYTNHIGIVTKLNNFIYRTPLYIDEKTDLYTNWVGIQSHIKSQTINDYFAFSYNPSISTYIGSTPFGNLIPYYFKVYYIRNDGSLIIDEIAVDDGRGNIINDYISGTIDYTTGNYIINTYKDVYDYQEVLANDSVITILGFLNFNVIEGTILIYYTISGTSYIAHDDGFGSIVGTGITSGSINYISGEISIEFSGYTDTGTQVISQFQYRVLPDITSGTNFVIECKTYDKLEVTELAIEDVNKNVLLYATFPPIEFEGMYNHIASAIMLRQV